MFEKALLTARVLARTGVIGLDRPDRFMRALAARRRWDRTPAAAIAIAAARFEDDTYLVDELGELSFADVERRTNALANGLAAAGIAATDAVAIMCRNSRYFVEATLACSKLGATALFLNTDFAGPQLAELAARENPRGVIFDEEFTALLAGAASGRRQFIAWSDGDAGTGTIEHLIATSDCSPPAPPATPGRQTILTSGTTGTPKGARRPTISSFFPIVAVLSVIELGARETQFVVAPMFHSWGFAHFALGLFLGDKLILRRRFDPEGVLQTIAEQRVNTAPMVPVMAQRILALPNEARRRYDCSSLTTIPLGGSALQGDLAVRLMDEFGDIVTNSYGSTEVGLITIASPQDLRAAPGTAGPPMPGIVLKILDPDGREAPRGEVGRIFAATEVEFEGYTGGGGKEVIGGAMSSGDVGYVDEAGRLFVSGRDDEMIVSGGENVFPREVEDLLASHDAIEEAAAIGIEDPEFGQRLKAYVVLCDGLHLTADDVKSYVRENLARFKVPREVEFLERLPRNPTGKILKRELAESERLRS